MTSTEGFQGASNSIFDEAAYFIDDVEYKQNAKAFAVTDSARQICRHPLLGKHHVDIGLIRLNNGKSKPSSRVMSNASGDHLSWFQRVIVPKTPVSCQLAVPDCRYGNTSNAKNTLQSGANSNYCGNSPAATDWITYEMLTVDAIPTAITFLNYHGSVRILSLPHSLNLSLVVSCSRRLLSL